MNLQVLTGPWEYDQLQAEAAHAIRKTDSFFLVAMTKDGPCLYTAHVGGEATTYLEMLETARGGALHVALRALQLLCEAAGAEEEGGAA